MGKNTLLNVFMAFGAYDLSGDTNRLDLPMTAEPKDATTFGSEGWKEVLAGKKMATWTFSGFNELELDAELFAALGASTAPISAVPANPPAPGDVAYFMRAMASSYKDGQSEGEVRSYELTTEGSGRVYRGVVLDYRTATATGDGPSVTMPAVGSDETLYYALHAVSASASDTLDLEIESDADDTYSSALTRATFDQVTDTSWQFGSVVGPITDVEYRVTRTLGGSSPSFRYLVVLAVA